MCRRLERTQPRTKLLAVTPIYRRKFAASLIAIPWLQIDGRSLQGRGRKGRVSSPRQIKKMKEVAESKCPDAVASMFLTSF